MTDSSSFLLQNNAKNDRLLHPSYKLLTTLYHLHPAHCSSIIDR